jgi:hypothetical protein
MTREEAIERIKARFDKWALDDEDMKAIQTLIPELRDSEDERIRKEIDTLYSEIDTCISELLKARTDKDSEAEGKALFKMEGLMVATLQDLSCIEDYLEKQKEQKPIKWTDLTWKDIVELEGIINNVHYDFSAGIGQESFGKEVLERFRSTKGIEYLDEAEQKCWRIVLPQPHYAFEEGQKEQKSAEKHDLVAKLKEHLANTPKEQLEAEWKELEKWNHVGPTVEEYLCGIKPAECEDCAMYLSGNCIHPNGKCENVKSKPEWGEEDQKSLNRAINICISDFGEDCETARFLKSLPERFNLQPKQEWSEEDRHAIVNCEYAIKETFKDEQNPHRIGTLDWFKSLRPSWKPSKEQMEALRKLMKYAVSLSSYYDIQKEIESLYNDLNKLK